MHSIKVPAADFSAGSLPEVCVRSGLLAENRYRIVARNSLGMPLNGAVSLHGSVARRISMLRMVGATALAIALASSVVAIAADDNSLLILTAAASLIALAALLTGARSGVHAQVIDNGEFVELSPVSDGFRLAIMVPPNKCSGCESGACGSNDEACADDHQTAGAH